MTQIAWEFYSMSTPVSRMSTPVSRMSTPVSRMSTPVSRMSKLHESHFYAR